MAEMVPPFLHKETALNIESSIPGSTVIVRLPSLNTSGWTSRDAQRRPLPIDITPSEDENSFRQKHLASAASIYRRQYHKSPRNFLWRVLEGNKVLAIRAADLYKQDKTDKIPDYHLTLRLYFPSPIRPACIAFSDSSEHDVLRSFILTESNHLYTLTLRPEFFIKRSSTEDNIGDWCKIFAARAFGPNHPHRLVALSPKELVISLHNGALLKLDKKPGGHGSAWDESYYNEGGWSSLRSLIPFQGNSTVRHGKVNMELSAVTSIASPSILIDGTPYVFTVCLDHRLRVWNLDSRKIAYNGDILDEDHPAHEVARYVIHPSQTQLVKVFQDATNKVLVVTFSPAGAGRFKFWSVANDMEDGLDLGDLFPDHILEPPAPTTDVWTLTDFSVGIDKTEPSRVSLWVLWKNNLSNRLQKLQFEIGTPNSIGEAWANGWEAVAGQVLNQVLPPTLLPTALESSTEKWLEHILYPGRFTVATVETALSLYERGIGGIRSSATRSKNLAERLCSLIGSSTTLGISADGGLDYEQFEIATDAQWRRFYRLVVELDKQRGEALSLYYDAEDDMAWVVRADGVSAIRDCSRMERFWHNPNADIFSALPEKAATLIFAASTFRDTFSDSFLHACETVVKAEMCQDLSAIDTTRLQLIHDNCNFVGQITDDDYDQLYQALGGSLKDVLRNEVYQVLLESLTPEHVLDDRVERLPLAELGKKLVVKGTQESIELLQGICLDQLMLLVFIEGEIDQEEEHIQVDTVRIFKHFLAVYKRLEFLSWLSKTQISIDIPKADRAESMQDKNNNSTAKTDLTKTITVLEECSSYLFGIAPHTGVPLSSLLTDLLVGVCLPESEYELDPRYIQCWLLKHDKADLSEGLSRFCDRNPFSVYVQGRVYLALEDFATAAAHFKNAAFGLAQPGLKIDRHSGGLLNDTEWNLLHTGLPSYYTHIVSLFDGYKSHSFVIEFARLGLQFTTSQSHDPNITNIRTDLQNRLFNAALQTSLFDLAYSTLNSFTNHALQASSIRALIFGMCEASAASQLLDLSFIGLQNTVDEILAQKCQGIVDVNAGIPYHKILYAWRIKRNDFRGAAAASLDRLHKLRMTGAGDKALRTDGSNGQDALETPITKQYLSLINALSCVDPEQAWILSEGVSDKHANDGVPTKREVITLEDARKGYQKELDRIAAIENGQFAFAGGDDMDVL